MRINFAAKWASAAVLFTLSVATGTAQSLNPGDVVFPNNFNGRVEVYNLSGRLPASSTYRCTNRGCDFVKQSIIVKPAEVDIIKYDDVSKRLIPGS